MATLGQKFNLALQDANLRSRLLFVLMILALFRLGTTIPIPSVDHVALAQFFSSNQFFGLLNVFSGGGLSNLSIFMLGVGPFITASIIFQLLTLIFPSVKEMYQEEGEAGRRKMAQYSRMLTVPLAVMQAFSLLIILENQGILADVSVLDRLLNVIVVTAGSLLLMWMGELINEYGIGNGVSMIIFAGIVASLPTAFSQLVATFDVAQIPIYLGFIVASIAIVAGIVAVSEADRPVPVTYAKQTRGSQVSGGVSTYLPIKVNNAGVMPIIFALSILLFPQMIANFLASAANTTAQSVGTSMLSVLNNQWVYGIGYFVLVFVFTYFYSAITFDPIRVSTNLQKSGAFIPGIRPGRATAEHLSRILTRLTFVGALFLAVVAMLPIVMQNLTGITTLALGGTSLLIVVSVALDLMKKIEAQMTMREY